ncbi:MAG: hypothetical protein AAGM38_03795 [Pseudomonadota bacterium]
MIDLSTISRWMQARRRDAAIAGAAGAGAALIAAVVSGGAILIAALSGAAAAAAACGAAAALEGAPDAAARRSDDSAPQSVAGAAAAPAPQTPADSQAAYCAILSAQLAAVETTTQTAALEIAQEVAALQERLTFLRSFGLPDEDYEELAQLGHSLVSRIQHQDKVRQQLECLRFGVDALGEEEGGGVAFSTMITALTERYVSADQHRAHAEAQARFGRITAPLAPASASGDARGADADERDVEFV